MWTMETRHRYDRDKLRVARIDRLSICTRQNARCPGTFANEAIRALILNLIVAGGSRALAKTEGSRRGQVTRQLKEARRRLSEGTTFNELAKSYNVGRATILRLQG